MFISIYRCLQWGGLAPFLAYFVLGTSFNHWYTLGFHSSTNTKLSLGSVDIKYLSDHDLASMLHDLESPQVSKKVHPLKLSFKTTYGLVNLLRHANLMRSFIQTRQHVIVHTNSFRSLEIRNLFLPHFQCQWNHLRKITIHVNTPELSHCLSAFTLFSTTPLESCCIKVNSDVLFSTKKERADSLIQNVIKLKEAFLPRIERVVIQVHTVDLNSETQASLNYHNFPWLLIFLEKLKVTTVVFQFHNALLQQMAALESSIAAQMSGVWVGEKSPIRSEDRIIFVKDSSKYILLENYQYIKTTVSWKQHHEKMKQQKPSQKSADI